MQSAGKSSIRNSKSSSELLRSKMTRNQPSSSRCIDSRETSNANSHSFAKFKAIKEFRETGDQVAFNELNSKYQLFTKGTPNSYCSDPETLKLNNIKNDIHTLDLPFIEKVVRQLKSPGSQSGSAQESQLNSRNYELYPTLMRKHKTSGKFKELLSDKQEVQDFLKWFEANITGIENSKKLTQIEKFQQKQVVIAAGLNEISCQVAKLSKPRSEIIKMLWNREAQEVESIVSSLSQSSIQNQKEYLESLSKTHHDYQNEIDTLKAENCQLQKRLSQELLINKGYVNTLRYSRKCARKYAILVKKLNEKYERLSVENLNLLEENTKLLITNNSMSSAEEHLRSQLSDRCQIPKSKGHHINSELKSLQAKVLLYRRLELKEKIKQMKRPSHKNRLVHEISCETDKEIQEADKDTILADKKTQLAQYLENRMREFPFEKLYILEEFIADEQSSLNTESIENILKRVLASKDAEFALKNEESIFRKSEKYDREIQQFGVNTHSIDGCQCISNKQEEVIQVCQKPLLQLQERGIQTQVTPEAPKSRNLLELNYEEESKFKVRESKLRLRNSLHNIELERLSIFRCQSQTEEGLDSKRKSISGNKRIRNLKKITDDKNAKLNFLALSRSVSEENNHINERNQQSESEDSSDMQTVFKEQLESIDEDLKAEHLPNNLNSEQLEKDVANSKMKPVIKVKGESGKRSQSKLSGRNKTVQNKKLKGSQESHNSESAELNLLRHDIEEMVKHHFEEKSEKIDTSKMPRSPQKFLNKILLALWKRILKGQYKNSNFSFAQNLYLTVQSSFGKGKQLIQKFLSLLTVVRHFEGKNDALSLTALFLRISANLSQYQAVLNNDASMLYFQVFQELTIYGPNEKKFDIWSPYTSITKIKSKAVEEILSKYFSKVKIMYIQMKIQEFISLMEKERSAKGNSSPSLKKNTKNHNSKKNLSDPLSAKYINTFTEDSAVVPLNSLALFVLEVYLTEKSEYYSSYRKMTVFLRSKQTSSSSLTNDDQNQEATISRSLLSTVLGEYMTLDSQQHKRILKKHVRGYDEGDCEVGQPISADGFYQICVEHDLPLFEEITASAVGRFKALPQQVQSMYNGLKLSSEQCETIKIKIFEKKSVELIEGYNFLIQTLMNYSDSLENTEKSALGSLREVYESVYFLVIWAAYSQN